MKLHFSLRSQAVEMLIKISDTPFDPWRELQNYQTKTTDLSGKFGATGIFIGTMRDFNEGDTIEGMILEHYPGMTEKCIAEAVQEAGRQWMILDCLVIHRVGTVYPNQPIVLVAVWTSHRGDAFDACRSIMETLKSTAPFWKKEFLSASEVKHSETGINSNTKETPAKQSRWVASNSDGYAGKNRTES